MPQSGHDKDMERALDEALMATFPASDPVALSGVRARIGHRPARRRWPPHARASAKKKP